MSTNRWDIVHRLPAATAGHAASVVGGRIYVFGGMREQGEPTDAVLVFDTGVRDAPDAADDLDVRNVASLGELTTTWGGLR